MDTNEGNLAQTPTLVKPPNVDPVETNPILALAAEVGFVDPTIDQLRRIVKSHGLTPHAWLPDRQLAARVVAERVARAKLMRHLEQVEGAL
jgi:hypothetical protein